MGLWGAGGGDDKERQNQADQSEIVPAALHLSEIWGHRGRQDRMGGGGGWQRRREREIQHYD